MLLFKREIKRNFTGFFIWIVTLGGYTFFTMSMFPTVSKNSAALDQYIKQLPSAMTKLFNLDKFAISNIFNFYNADVGILLILSLGIYSMLLGSGMLSKEIDDKTIEFLQAKPITRNSIITEKMLCYSVYIAVINIILFFTTFISFEYVKTKAYPVKTLFLIYVGYFFVELTFANLGLLLSLFIKKRKSSTSLSLWFVLGMYFLYIFLGISEKLNFLKYITPFKYADSADIIASGNLNSIYIIILICVNIVAVISSYIIYNHKDIFA